MAEIIVPEIVTPEQDAATAEVRTEAAVIVREAGACVVRDPASFDAAGALLVRLNRSAKALEERRKSVKAPLLELTRQLDAWFAAQTKPLTDAIAALKRGCLDYQRDQERLAREAERKRLEAEEAARRAEEAERARQAAAAAPDAAPAPEDDGADLAAEFAAAAAADAERAVAIAPPPAKSTRTAEGGSVGFREAWKFEIVDVAALPRQWMVPNEKGIRAAVNAGVREIPGVRIYADREVAVRR